MKTITNNSNGIKKSVREVQNIVRTRRPSHPGAIVAGIAEDFNLTQQQIADSLGVGRLTVNELMGGKRRITPEMALRLSRAFNGSPGVWMRMQLAVDLWDAEHSEKAKEIEQTIRPMHLVA